MWVPLFGMNTLRFMELNSNLLLAYFFLYTFFLAINSLIDKLNCDRTLYFVLLFNKLVSDRVVFFLSNLNSDCV